MNLNIEKSDNYTKVKVKDKLDKNTAPLLKSELIVLIGKNEKNILLDVSKCTDCDEVGVNALLLANRLCKNANGNLIIGGVQKHMEHILSITQADRTLNLSYNLSKAEEELLLRVSA